MNNLNEHKKSWIKPSVHLLVIKKDTFSGSTTLPETQGGNGSGNVPRDPTPR